MTEQLTFPPMSSVSPKLQYYSAIDRSPVSVLKKSQLLHIYVDVGKMEETSCKRQDTGDRARVQRKQKLKTREQRPPNLQQRVKGQGCWFQASHSYAVVSNSLWPIDCSPPGSSVHGISQARILGWYFLLQGVFHTQGSNQCVLHLLHCRQILSHWATWEVGFMYGMGIISIFMLREVSPKE